MIQIIHYDSNDVRMDGREKNRLWDNVWQMECKGKLSSDVQGWSDRITMRTESGLGGKCKAIVYREYKEGRACLHLNVMVRGKGIGCWKQRVVRFVEWNRRQIM